MATFHYQGRDQNGKLVEGDVAASSVEAVVDVLIQKHITPTNIVVGKKKADPFAFLKKEIFLKSVESEDLISFCRQMYSLTKAGVPLLQSLTLIVDTTKSRLLAKSLQGIIEDITAGQTLTNALKKVPDVFPNVFISIVDAGENSGQLESTFIQLADYLSLGVKTKKQIKAATRYPTLVVSAIFIALIIVNFFVVPNFSRLFKQFQVDLPWPSLVLISVSNFMLNNWLILLVALIAVVVTFHYYIKTEKGGYVWDRWKLKIPIIGDLINRIILGRFTRSFAMILRTGVPLIQGVELVSDVVGNNYVKKNVLMMRDGIQRGETLTKTAADSKLFSPLVLQMFSIGEESGTVDTLLEEVAEFYEAEVDYDLKRLGDLIEPILLAILGGMVLVLALGIFLPMWEMVKFARR